MELVNVSPTVHTSVSSLILVVVALNGLIPAAQSSHASEVDPEVRSKRQSLWDQIGSSFAGLNDLQSSSFIQQNPVPTKRAYKSNRLSKINSAVTPASSNSRQNQNVASQRASTQQTTQGVRIRSHNFYNCSSSLWSNHFLWAEHFEITPYAPRFPGSIYINMSLWVDQDLPADVDAEFEIRAEKVVGFGQNPFEFIPCHGYNIDPTSNEQGCGGIGSCRYCNIMGKYCKEYLGESECPPRQGRYGVTLTQTILEKDIPTSLFGPLKSTKYWIKVRLVQSYSAAEIACGMVVLDICKFNLWDRSETCVD